MADDLWPTEFGELKVKPPVSILREQGRALGERTSNIVYGTTTPSSSPPEGQFRHTFELWCSPLNYRLPLLTVDHAIELYPAKIHVHVGHDGPMLLEARDSEEFESRLREVFSRPATKTVIASLIAQSRQ
jgi:hypothetical protein